MESHGERVMLAAITAPLAVMPTSAAWAVLYWIASRSPASVPDTLQFSDKPWSLALLCSIYGMFTAYLSLPLFVALYYCIRRLRLVSYPSVIFAGLLTCVPAALFFGRSGVAFGWLIFLLPYGASVATVFLWRMQRAGVESR